MEQENNQDKTNVEKQKRKARQTKKTVQPLPDPRLNIDKQIKIIKAICAASDKGSKYVTSQEVAPLASVHDTEASGVCSFFFKIDLLDRDNYKYKPKEALINFCNDLEWSPDTAGDALKDEFSNTWFGKSIIDYFKVSKEANKEALIKNLGRVAQADSDYHKRALSTLVDFVAFANIINYDESSKKYTLVNSVSSPKSINPGQKTQENKEEQSPKSENSPLKSSIQKQEQSKTVGTMVNINLDVKFAEDTDPEELAKKIKKFKELIK